jgi:putative ABC transport system permease protein
MRLLPFDYAIRNLGRSPKRLVLVTGGSTLVSLLVLGSVAFARGLERSLAATGLDTNALLIGSGSEESVERSELPAATADVLAASVDGLAVVAGMPAVSPEIHVALPARVDRAADPADAPRRDAPPAVFRGIEPQAFIVHPQVRLVEGRWPARGADEIAASPGALARLGGDAGLGTRVEVAGTLFEICGRFEAPGTAMHGEFWMRLDRLAQLTQRTTHSCVVAALGDAELDDVDAFTASRLDLESIAMRESDYYARLGEFFAPIRLLVIVTAVLISTGGALGGVNAMYAAFASRVREVGTLQALGFSRAAIAVSLLIESTVACVAGALIACVIALAALDGIAIDFSMGSFGLAVDSAAIASALAAGALLGILGAMPAIARCLVLSIPAALRA